MNPNSMSDDESDVDVEVNEHDLERFLADKMYRYEIPTSSSPIYEEQDDEDISNKNNNVDEGYDKDPPVEEIVEPHYRPLPWYFFPSLVCGFIGCIAVVVVIVVAVLVFQEDDGRSSSFSGIGGSEEDPPIVPQDENDSAGSGDSGNGGMDNIVSQGGTTCTSADLFDFSTTTSSFRLQGDTRVAGNKPYTSICGISSSAGRGLFYRLQLPDSEPGRMSVSLCPQEAADGSGGALSSLMHMAVVTGTCGDREDFFGNPVGEFVEDENLQCITSKSISAEEFCNPATSSVSWYAEGGQEYYLYVQDYDGNNEGSDESGHPFELTVSRAWTPLSSSSNMEFLGKELFGHLGVSVATSADGFLVVAGEDFQDLPEANNGVGNIRVYRRMEHEDGSVSYTENLPPIGAPPRPEGQDGRFGVYVDLSNDGYTMVVTSNTAVTIIRFTNDDLSDMSNTLEYTVEHVESFHDVSEELYYATISGDGNTVAWHFGNTGTTQLLRRSASGSWEKFGTDIGNGFLEGNAVGNYNLLALTYDGNVLAVVGQNDVVRLYDLAVFEDDSSSGSQLTARSEFNGYASVALTDDGNCVALGLPSSHTPDNESMVKVYCMEEEDNEMVAMEVGGGALTEGSNSKFGHSLSFAQNGNRLAVGAPWFDPDPNTRLTENHGSDGRVFVYQINPETKTWEKQGEVFVSEPNQSVILGWSLSLSSDGSTLVTGGPWYDTATDSDAENKGMIRIAQFS